MICQKVGKITKPEVLDEVRKTLVIAAINGERMCLMIGNQAPDFKTNFTDPKILPCDKIFNFHVWRNIENYKSIVSDNEDYDTQGNKGCYMMSADYTLVILSTAKEEEDKQAVIDGIPGCLENFEIMEIIP